MNPNDLLSLLGPQPGIQQTQGAGAGQPNTGAAPVNSLPYMQNAPPVPQAPPPSLWQRVQASMMPTPEGMSGLLGDSDIHRARGRGLLDFGLSLLANSRGQNGGNAPGFGQALQAGVGAMRQGYGEDINNTVQGTMQGQQLSQQKAILQGRQAIGQFIRSNLTGDKDKDTAVLRKAYMMFGAINDNESMKTLSPVIEKSMDAPPPLQAVPTGGTTTLLQPGTTNVAGVLNHTPAPIDPQTAEERKTRIQLAIDAANARGDARTAQELSQQAMKEDRFITTMQSDPDMKYGTAVAQVAGQLNALRPRALANDPFAQYQAIEGALRLRNPEMNRAPNPQDYAALANAMGLTGKARQLMLKYEQGTILPADVMRKLYETSDAMVQQGRNRYTHSRQYHLGIAKGQGVDSSLVPDAFATVEAPPAPVTGAARVRQYLPSVQ
jgi:hypothetical protein